MRNEQAKTTTNRVSYWRTHFFFACEDVFMILISCDASVRTHWSFMHHMNILSVGNEGDIALVVFYLLFAQIHPNKTALLQLNLFTHTHVHNHEYTNTNPIE